MPCMAFPRFLPLLLIPLLLCHAALALPQFATLPDASPSPSPASPSESATNPTSQQPTSSSTPADAKAPAAKTRSKYDEYGPSLDAGTSDELIKLLQKIHADAGADQAKTRPVYAPKSVVNAAYAEWNKGRNDGGAGNVACTSDEVSFAVFATPNSCMAKTPKPGNLPTHLGKLRAFMRRSPQTTPEPTKCVYTNVMCVTPDVVLGTAQDAIDRITKDFEPRRKGSAFWYQTRLYALNSVANEAFRKKFPNAGTKPDEDLCKKQDSESNSSVGSLYVSFPESEECLTKKTTSEGKACRYVMLECL